jgi:hypothetical protein
MSYLWARDSMIKDDATIIYFTSNREDEEFEKKIQKILLRTSENRFPIISVSQKPIKFGENICIGDVGANDNNLYRQVLIACEAAKTPFVISAEADNLYPYDYFNYEPEKLDRVYRYGNVWVLKYWRSYFVRKSWCEGAQIIGREYYIDLIKKELEGRPAWSKERYPTNPFRNLKRDWTYYSTEVPVISIKTGRGLRANTVTNNREFTRSLLYWGSTRVVKRKLGMLP